MMWPYHAIIWATVNRAILPRFVPHALRLHIEQPFHFPLNGSIAEVAATEHFDDYNDMAHLATQLAMNRAILAGYCSIRKQTANDLKLADFMRDAAACRDLHCVCVSR